MKLYAHEIQPHPAEAEALPVRVLVRYHLAQAAAWHLAFAETISGPIDGARMDFALSQYLRHSHLAMLHHALALGLSGQAAADWASVRQHSESVELLYDVAELYALDLDTIRPYETLRKADR